MYWAAHVLQWYLQKKAILKNKANEHKLYLCSDYSLKLEYEAEIVSNRRLESFGEPGSESSTHRPSRQESCFCQKKEYYFFINL